MSSQCEFYEQREQWTTEQTTRWENCWLISLHNFHLKMIRLNAVTSTVISNITCVFGFQLAFNKHYFPQTRDLCGLNDAKWFDFSCNLIKTCWFMLQFIWPLVWNLHFTWHKLQISWISIHFTSHRSLLTLLQLSDGLPSLCHQHNFAWQRKFSNMRRKELREKDNPFVIHVNSHFQKY